MKRKLPKKWSIITENEDRVRRATSWLRKGKRARSDIERFLCLWIALNAAYGYVARGVSDEGGQGLTEKEQREKFFKNICKQKKSTKWLRKVFLDKEWAKTVDDVMNNEFIYEGYWDCVRGKKRRFEKREIFENQNEKVKSAVTSGSWVFLDALRGVFERLCVLRNQIVHGGVTVRNGVGGRQLRSGSRVMEKIVPVMLKIMKADIGEDPGSETWGHLRYPSHEPLPRRPLRTTRHSTLYGRS